MKNELAGADIGAHCNLGTAGGRDILLRAVELCRGDPRFALPATAHDIDVRGLDVVVFGTTSYAQIFMRAAARRDINVLAAVDDFRGGLECVGKPIIASRDVAALRRRHAHLLAVHSGRNDRAIRHFERVADEAGVPVITFEQAVRLFGLGDLVDYRVADWGPEICTRTDEFLALEERAVDDYSRQTLHGVLLFHLTGSMEWIHGISRPYPTLYFRSGLFTVGSEERLVDCGASIGESTGGLLALTRNRIGRSWMLEPDKFNHARLEALIAEAPAAVRHRLSLHKVAVGSAAGRMRFNHVGGHTGSITADSHAYGEIEEVEVRTIDATIDAPPTFIKMDIEGAELDALRGATGAIRSGRPKMAISAYHRTTDLIDLPRFVDSIDPGYRIGIRHHTEERYDTCLYFLPQ